VGDGSEISECIDRNMSILKGRARRTQYPIAIDEVRNRVYKGSESDDSDVRSAK
jgi:hypothetical protein